MSEPIWIELDSVRIDGGTQMRVEIDEDVVAEYADAMHDGATFPPVTVVFDGASYWLADGFHRYHAHRKLNRTSIKVDAVTGGKDDAVLMAAGANGEHGLRRSSADKRKAVSTVIGLTLCAGWSDREIARHCVVSPSFVGTVRRVTVHVDSDDRQYVDKHGNLSTMKTSGINAGRPKSPAQQAKEAARAEQKERDDTLAADEDELRRMADELNRENARLVEENAALKADDIKAELAKQIELRRISDQQSRTQTTTIHEMDKDLRRYVAWFKELRQLTGCESNTAAMAAIRIAFQRSA